MQIVWRLYLISVHGGRSFLNSLTVITSNPPSWLLVFFFSSYLSIHQSRFPVCQFARATSMMLTFFVSQSLRRHFLCLIKVFRAVSVIITLPPIASSLV